MKQIKLYTEKDQVIFDLNGCRNDLILTCLQAVNLADQLDELAAIAEKEDPTVSNGEQWEVKIESYDRKIAIRFFYPWQYARCPRTVPIPARVAKRFAELIRNKVSYAQYGMRINLGNPNRHYSRVYNQGVN